MPQNFIVRNEFYQTFTLILNHNSSLNVRIYIHIYALIVIASTEGFHLNVGSLVQSQLLQLIIFSMKLYHIHYISLGLVLQRDFSKYLIVTLIRQIIHMMIYL